jgi:dTDP-4-dehydrorhamnose 3,5-epimerase
METLATTLEGVLILDPPVFHDDRGFMMETWHHRSFADATGSDLEFVQDNLSGSRRRVLRGLHYQVAPRPQGKLVQVTAGSIYDVAVDLRLSSSTYGGWFGLELSGQQQRQLWIPPGFAHGFLVTSDWAEVRYKLTSYREPTCERVIRWDDPDIGIVWPLQGPPILSERDARAPGLGQAEAYV